MFTSLLSVQEPGVLLLKRWLRLLSVQVTDTALENSLLNHPDYPSLLSLSDTLRTYKINNVAANVPKEQLAQLPLPFVAHTHAGGGENFALVTDVGENEVRYFIDEKKQTQPIEAFIKDWTGVALLGEKGEASGEKNYETSRRKERIKALKFPLLLFAFMFIASISIFTFYNQTLLLAFSFGFAILLLLKLTGVVVTSLLLWYEIDKTAPALQKICTAGAKTNCNAILSSKEARLFSWLSWSEVGFFYFTVGFILLLLVGFTSSRSLLPLIVLLNLVALPYTLFSLYYQWRIAKQWCPLCLSVQALLILEFITSLSTGLLSSSFQSLPLLSFNHAIRSSVPLISSLLLVAIAWFLLKPLLLKAEEAKRTKRELARLKANPQIWEALLAKGKQIIASTDGLGIVLGNPAASNTLIKVCNPYCGPCAKAHPEIEKLLEENNNLKVQIIFTATNDENDFKAPPVKHLLAIAEKEDEQITKGALDDWYLADKKDYKAFADKYPMNGELKKQDAKIEAMQVWCDEMKIAFTPTLFVNGHQLPEVYNIHDIQHFLY